MHNMQDELNHVECYRLSEVHKVLLLARHWTLRGYIYDTIIPSSPSILICTRPFAACLSSWTMMQFISNHAHAVQDGHLLGFVNLIYDEVILNQLQRWMQIPHLLIYQEHLVMMFNINNMSRHQWYSLEWTMRLDADGWFDGFGCHWDADNGERARRRCWSLKVLRGF